MDFVDTVLREALQETGLIELIAAASVWASVRQSSEQVKRDADERLMRAVTALRKTK